MLSGGDQLAFERQCCAQMHVLDGDTPCDRLQLLEPVCEDWHPLMCFMTVSNIEYYMHGLGLHKIDLVKNMGV